MGCLESFAPVPELITLYYFRATSMARLCLVRPIGHWYCADRDSCTFSPEGDRAGMGGIYASDAPLLRGNWICGGPLDFPAAVFAGDGSSFAFPVAGASVRH